VTGNWIKYLSVLIARHPKYFKRTGTRKNRKYLRSEEGEAALSAKTVETAVLGAVTKDSFVSIRTVMRRSKLSRSIVKQELAELRSQGRVRYRWGEKTNESEWCLV
jgi:ribosomal protein S25